VHPDQLLPEPLRKFNASFWSQSISEVVPSILAGIALTPESQRIFVSYRRLETEPLAEQFFEALNRQGFQVFVDRFVVPPGVDFQRRLDQELADKSMVLLLESEKFYTSEWTRHEAIYTKQYRLGLFALQMPHGLPLPDQRAGQVTYAPVPRIPEVGEESRRVLREFDFEAGHFLREVVDGKGEKFLMWGPLTKGALADVVGEIRKRHDIALLRRRQYIRDAVHQELLKAGAKVHGMRADGLLAVGGEPDSSNHDDSCSPKEYAVWLTTRPPEVPDFYVTYTGCKPAKRKGVIVGPLALLEEEIGDRLQWLSGVCEFVCADEGQIVSIAAKIAKGCL
jgi:hypothetical protein